MRLNRKQKAKCKSILTLLVVSMLMQRIAKDQGIDNEPNQAVNHCIAYIDETFADHTDLVIAQMRFIVNRARRKLTSDVKDMSTGDGLVGALKVLTSGMFRTKPGTRLDYIIQTFQENLDTIEKTQEVDDKEVKRFVSLLRKTLASI